MALFQIKWLRRLVRKHTNPIPHEEAHNWKRRLSILYMLLGWNAFGMVCYMIYSGKNDWAKYYGYKQEDTLTPGEEYAKMLKIDKAKIVRFSGFQKVSEVELDNTKAPASDS